jgi:error-prone DNA polymerase
MDFPARRCQSPIRRKQRGGCGLAGREQMAISQGFVFLSPDGETGMMNAIVSPATFDRFKFEVLGEPYLIIDSILQNQDGVISMKAGRVTALRAGAAPESHDFY